MTSKIKRNSMTGKGPGDQELPFARSVEANGFVFVSGQVAFNKEGVIHGDITAQARQTIENVKKVLAEAGCGLEDVVKVNVWLEDPRDFWSFNGVFKEYFIDHPPARSTVASPLMVDGKIEMDVIACKKSA